MTTLRRRSRALTLVVAATLSGCLTSALWNLSDRDAVPRLQFHNSAFEVTAVRTSHPDQAVPNALDLELQTATLPGLDVPPSQIAHFRGDRKGRLHLERRPPLAASATAAGWFAADGWFLSLFDGEHLTRRGHIARLSWVGAVDADRIGARVEPPALVPDWWHARLADDFVPMEVFESRAVRGLAEVDWLRLVDPDTVRFDGRLAPVAWLDADGSRVEDLSIDTLVLRAESDAEVAARVQGIGLLARHDSVQGEPIWLRLPLPLLLDAEDLAMRRQGSRILFVKHERWDGEFVDPAAAALPTAEWALPLGSPMITYSWAETQPTTSALLEGVQYTLTPITALLDFVILTAPPLARLAAWLKGDEDRAWLRRELERSKRQ